MSPKFSRFIIDIIGNKILFNYADLEEYFAREGEIARNLFILFKVPNNLF